jgi:TonB family protein
MKAMKFYLVLFIFLIVYSSESNAQYLNESSKKYYKEKLEPDSKLIKAAANYTIERTPDKVFIYKRYYPENKMITQLETSNNNQFKKLNGPYMEAYDDGTIVEKGLLVDNVKEGFWIEDVSRSGYYKNGYKEGLWKEFSKDSILLCEWNYVLGQLDGSAIRYDTTGKVSHQSEYKAGALISTTKIVKQELPRISGCEDQRLDKEAYKECTDKKLMKAVYSGLKYPYKAKVNGIQGQVKLQFVVTKTGDITDVKVLNGVCQEIKYECLRVLTKMPKWMPGTEDGVPVDMVYTLPINFVIR